MTTPFTADEVGKRVETAAGEPLGVVRTVEEETVYVTADEGARETIRSVLDWEAETEETVPVDKSAVSEVTAEAIRLEAPSDGGTDPVIDRDEHTEEEFTNSERQDLGSEADLDPDDSSADGRSGTGVQPTTAEMTESGEERHPDEDEEGDRPPEGDRTVTRERGHEDDR